MDFDRRSRFDRARAASMTPDQLLGEVVPAAIAAHPELVDRASHIDLRPLAVVVDGTCWHFERRGREVQIVPVDDPGQRPVLRLSATQLDDLIADRITPVGLMTSGTLSLTGCGIGRVLDWWLVLRSVLDGEAVYRPGDVPLPDGYGTSFTLEADPEDLRSFLATAGYLHLRGVFTDEEMAAVSDDMDRAAPHYTDGDGESWWVTLADGSRRVVRMQGFESRSEVVASLLGDERFTAIGAIPCCGHVLKPGDNRVEALFKPIGVRDGISDVPWHKDCSLGRHSYECCRLTVGISVTGAGPGSGQLRVVAGSHRARIWPSLLDVNRLDLPQVPLATETGDVTVHLSCTLHMAEPPLHRERRVLYTDFELPPPDPDAAAAARRQFLTRAREGAPRNVSQQASPRAMPMP
jgi:hypothetical protein